MTAADSSATENTQSQDEERTAEIREYWTPERLRAARPLPLPSVSPEEWEKTLPGEPGEGPPASAPVLPSGDSGDEVDASAYPVDVKKRPYWNAGKLFFTTPEGDAAGSAAFVGSNQMLMTAAHCVRSDSGEWYQNFAFIRAGHEEGGGFTGQVVSVDFIGAWMMFIGRNFRYDYAFLRTTSKSGAGWLGLTTACPYSSFTSLGYPYNYASGSAMYGADGTRGAIADGIVSMDGNPMTQGCSGGPWVGALSHEYSPTANIACGLNSVGNPSVPNVMRGPLFDDETIALYRCVENGGGC